MRGREVGRRESEVGSFTDHGQTVEETNKIYDSKLVGSIFLSFLTPDLFPEKLSKNRMTTFFVLRVNG